MVCVETDPFEALRCSIAAMQANKQVKIDKPPGVTLGLLGCVYR